MKNKTNMLYRAGMALLFTLCCTACSHMKVGYLRTTGASFSPDSINAFHNVDPTSEQYIEKIPFVSTRIQGVAGTHPINYELAHVKADNATAAQLFMKLYHEQLISVAGGMVVVTQEATKQLPNGHYYLTFRIFNDDHEALLENVFKVVVTDDELPLS